MKNEKLMKENVSITPISWNNNCYYALHILTKEREREREQNRLRLNICNHFATSHNDRVLKLSGKDTIFDMSRNQSFATN